MVSGLERRAAVVPQINRSSIFRQSLIVFPEPVHMGFDTFVAPELALSTRILGVWKCFEKAFSRICDKIVSRKFLGQILHFAKKNAPEEVTRDISAKLPDVDKLIDEATSTTTPGPDGEPQKPNDLLKPCMPLLEMIKKLVEDIIGGDAAKTIEVANIIERSGVPPEKGAEMIQKLLGFMEEKVGPETISTLKEQVPALQAII